MEWFLQTTYTISLPVLLGYIVYLLKEQKKSRDANSTGTKCLLRVKLIEYHDKYVELGYIPTYVLDNWNELYMAYKNLGGNGTITSMNDEIKKLQIK